MTFFAPDNEAFPAMDICRRAIERGGAVPAAVNAANEQAVALFRRGAIGFADISRLAEKTVERSWPQGGTLETILAADTESRRLILEEIG